MVPLLGNLFNLLVVNINSYSNFGFEKNGFLILKKILPSKSLLIASKDIEQDLKIHKVKLEQQNYIHEFNVGKNSLSFIELFKQNLIVAVKRLLGENILLFHSHLDINCSDVDPTRNLKWHRDIDIIERDLNTFNTPMLSIKSDVFPCDCSMNGMGNLHVVPKIHLWKAQHQKNKLEKRKVPLLVKTREIILCDRRIWHARWINTSSTYRKVLFYEFTFRLLANRDTKIPTPKIHRYHFCQ